MFLSNKEVRKAGKGWLGKAVDTFSPGTWTRGAEVVFYRGTELHFVPWYKQANPFKDRAHGWQILNINDYPEHVSLVVQPGSMAYKHLIIPKESVLYLSQVAVADIPWEGQGPQISGGKALVAGLIGGALGASAQNADLKAFMEGTAICLAYERDGFENSVFVYQARREELQETLEFLRGVLGSPPTELPATSKLRPPPTGAPLSTQPPPPTGAPLSTQPPPPVGAHVPPDD